MNEQINTALAANMAGMTPQERRRYMLALCDEAIVAIMRGAQSYSIAGQSLTRANLADLRAWRRELAGEIAAADAGGRRRMKRVSFVCSNRNG